MALAVGDRRWAMQDGRVVELLFVDQVDEKVRILVHSGFPEGQPMTLDGHAVKVIVVRAKVIVVRAIQTYPVGSENATLQRKIAEHGTPKSMPTISTEAIEEHITQAPMSAAEVPARSAPPSVTSEDDTQVKILTMMYELSDGQKDIRGRLEMLERERGPRLCRRAHHRAIRSLA